jgi:hypothetical protein
VRGKLPVYAAPAALLLLPDLPLLPSGKPDREALRARAAAVKGKKEAGGGADPPGGRWAHGTTTGTNGRAERY